MMNRIKKLTSPDYKDKYDKANEIIENLKKLSEAYTQEIEELKNKLNIEITERKNSSKEIEKLKSEKN